MSFFIKTSSNICVIRTFSYNSAKACATILPRGEGFRAFSHMTFCPMGSGFAAFLLGEWGFRPLKKIPLGRPGGC